jgi:sorbitol/mannitol transport system permease protein
MAREVTLQRKLGFTALAWLVALLLFFPILWTILTSFKSEAEAIASPPTIIPNWTIENYIEVQDRADYFRHFANSVWISVGSTLLALLIAIPSAWAMAFTPTPRY